MHSNGTDTALTLAGLRIEALRSVLGFRTQLALAKATGVSLDTIQRMEKGIKVKNSTRLQVAGALLIDVCEISPSYVEQWSELHGLCERVRAKGAIARLSEPLSRIRGHCEALQYYWFKPERAIRELYDAYALMRYDLAILSKSLDTLSILDRILLGQFAGTLASAICQFFGCTAESDLPWVLATASACATSIDTQFPEQAAAILASRYYNAIGTSAWYQPDKHLGQIEGETALCNFSIAEHLTQLARGVSESYDGLDGHDTLELRLSRAQMLIQRGAQWWDKAGNLIDESLARMSPPDDRIVAHALFLRSFLKSKSTNHRNRTAAVELLQDAVARYKVVVGEGGHHLVSSCRTRLRQLGVAESEWIEEDTDILHRTAIRFTNIVDLDAVRSVR